jgi:ubiquinone/menaquinone biosynthesis C-methylase UbiE
MNPSHTAGVVQHYDGHPINEEQILSKLAARGTNLEALTEDQLIDLDQDHSGGVQAGDALAAHAGIRRGHHVLDVCSGMGGPARWIAHRLGCRVTGLDLTKSRVESARRLTRLTKLDHLVDFVEGDATAMPFADSLYDAVLGQEAWVHVPDKSTLIGQCVRVTKAGAPTAFTDFVARTALTPEENAKLNSAIQAAEAVTPQHYLDVLARHRCVGGGRVPTG